MVAPGALERVIDEIAGQIREWNTGDDDNGDADGGGR